MTDLQDYHRTLCQKARELMGRKNHDYTSNSGDRYHNFRGSLVFGIHPVIGILLRMMDKLMRVHTYAATGKLEVSNEGLEDALKDIINYTVLIGGYYQEVEHECDENDVGQAGCINCQVRGSTD